MGVFTFLHILHIFAKFESANDEEVLNTRFNILVAMFSFISRKVRPPFYILFYILFSELLPTVSFFSPETQIGFVLWSLMAVFTTGDR